MQLLVDALANAGERLNALEARPEVQALPSTPQEGGPTLLAPIQLQQGAEPACGLVEHLMAQGYGKTHARAAILATAEWFTSKEWHITAAVLRRQVERG